MSRPLDQPFLRLFDTYRPISLKYTRLIDEGLVGKKALGIYNGGKNDIFHILRQCVAECSECFRSTPLPYLWYRVEARLWSHLYPHQEFTGIDPDPVYTDIFEKYLRAVKETRNYMEEVESTSFDELAEVCRIYSKRLDQSRRSIGKKQEDGEKFNRSVGETETRTGDDAGCTREYPRDVTQQLSNYSRGNTMAEAKPVDTHGDTKRDAIKTSKNIYMEQGLVVGAVSVDEIDADLATDDDWTLV